MENQEEQIIDTVLPLPSSEPVEAITNIQTYPDSNYLRLKTFAYLRGDELFHKIALLSKSVSETLPNAGLLDQKIVLGVKNSMGACHPDYMPVDSFRYALRLVDTIEIVVRQLEGGSYLKCL